MVSRLVSLKNENYPEKARIEIIEILNNSKVSGDWTKRESLSKVNNKDTFTKWHAKTVDRTHGDYRKILINRVNSSKKLTNET